ncbi:potassium-transporting ATPase subunit KdpC [Luteibacter aegosomaticola]|uniref:potassium-transporting ATPase subunit KdpC n=1 Tax=Luteibacter aegosomaticola TaxID=2911538 RepID=UPI001FF88B31|nr:potassium-transporting ATPase subunit KdpC [Luteibacter aegosomaticola]UPG90509.1 potassium-transporting ATPase subunit KdpC [Luteibacter aegosomaticola]
MTHSLVRPALVSAVLFMAITGVAYPLASTALATAFFPSQSAGSLVRNGDTVVGSGQLGQNFTQPRYFHPRPSVTGDTPYNAAASGASNLGATSAKLRDAVAERAAAYRKENQLPASAPVPVDAVTASASGLDPDISVANALAQVSRVAAARHVPAATVADLVAQQRQGRQWGFLGEPRVNVLALNRALDAAH